MIHWQRASCILAEDYDGNVNPGHTFTDKVEELTCPVCVFAKGGKAFGKEGSDEE